MAGASKRSTKRLAVTSVQDLAAVVRMRRGEMRLTIAQVAELAEVSRFFVSDLEKGKPSVQFDKIMAVLGALQLKVELKAGTPKFKKTTAAKTAPPPLRAKKAAVPLERTHDDPEVVKCMECAAGVRNLQKHLSTAHSMRTAEYRRKWHLPEGYSLKARSLVESEETRARTKRAMLK